MAQQMDVRDEIGEVDDDAANAVRANAVGANAGPADIAAQETQVFPERYWVELATIRSAPHAISAHAPRSTQTPDGFRSRPLALTVLACLLLLLVAGALDGMQQYALVRSQALDALHHIQAAQALLDAKALGQPLDAATLSALDAELAAADQDSARLSAELGDPSGVALLGAHIPRLATRIAEAAALASAADHACQAGRALIAAARIVLALHAGGFIDGAGRLMHRGLTSPQANDLLQRMQANIGLAASQFAAAVARAQSADLSVLPPSIASPAQVAGLRALLADWAGLHARLAAPDGWRLLVPVVLHGAPLGGLL